MCYFSELEHIAHYIAKNIKESKLMAMVKISDKVSLNRRNCYL